MDTIFALATAQGRAGVSVIRISGPDACAAASKMMSSVPQSRGLRHLKDRDGTLLDEALVLRFSDGKSFTGEDVIELHLHGSQAVIAVVSRVLGSDPRLRQAEAGEFTRRALENGKLDLAQVEGLADLIDAETESQRKQSIRVLAGDLGHIVQDWRTKLIRAAALLEATIDFVDEDVPIDVRPEVVSLLTSVQEAMASEIAGVGIAERVRDGFEIAIVGAPNVGKSTLLNRLAGRDAAITSDIAGTTRDVIEVRMDLGGIPVTILDTAGLRETDDTVEIIGVTRTKERAKQADLRIFLVEGDGAPLMTPLPDDLIVWAKADEQPHTGLAVSGLTGQGIDELVAQLTIILRGRVARVGIAMRERHRVAMQRAITYLVTAITGLENDLGMSDLIAEDIRTAVRAVDSLVGHVDVEHILDEIFMRFCIGK